MYIIFLSGGSPDILRVWHGFDFLGFDDFRLSLLVFQLPHLDHFMSTHLNRPAYKFSAHFFTAFSLHHMGLIFFFNFMLRSEKVKRAPKFSCSLCHLVVDLKKKNKPQAACLFKRCSLFYFCLILFYLYFLPLVLSYIFSMQTIPGM